MQGILQGFRVVGTSSKLGKDYPVVAYRYGGAVLTFVIREFANMPEGCSFSILLMNLLTPYIDKLTMTHPFGAKPAVKKEAK